MVSIRKAKKGFQLRRRNHDIVGMTGLSQANKEKVGLIVAGLCIGVLFVIFTGLGGDGSSTTGSGPGSGTDSRNINVDLAANNPLRHRKPHPQLLVEEEDEDDGPPDELPILNNEIDHVKESKNLKKAHPVSDAYNAMALDILETLDCEQLFDTTMKEIKGSISDGAGGMDEPVEESNDQEPLDGVNDRRQRRRLEKIPNQQHGDDGGFENLQADADANAINGGGGGGGVADKDDDDANAGEGDDEEEKWGREAMRGIDDGLPARRFEGDRDDDQMLGDDANFLGFDGTSLSAQHLFCLAAREESPTEIVSKLSCAASGHKRRTLLDLWTAARAQISDESLLKKVLGVTQEFSTQQILNRNYNLWAPKDDKGLEFMVNTLNNELQETITTLSPSLGKGKLFVDVGSGSGLTTLAITHKYPGTKIVSIEPASPNWLLQELNLRCNLPKADFTNIKLILAGVGPNTDEEDNMMAKLMWRPTSTTSTRSWTPAEEHLPGDVELLVRLRKLRSILAEADVYLTNNGSSSNMMDVLNLDCQGCEYNVIPALKEDEFDAIPNVMGAVHWGYIPPSKLPSSERGKKTHERLCQHETIAKMTKECCGFLNIPVKSNIPGEVLYRDKSDEEKNGNAPLERVTVSDIIQDGLCDDYEDWSIQHFVNAIQDDWGWFELSSQAQ